jgi:hypothetical protein
MRTLRSSTTRYTVLKATTLIDPGNDLEQDYISCGPGFDTVNQEPILGAATDVIEDDCELVAV